MDIKSIKQMLRPEFFLIATTTPSFLSCKGKEECQRGSRKTLAWIGDRILLKVVKLQVPRNHISRFVSAKHLFRVGEQIGIFPYLRCSKFERRLYRKTDVKRILSRRRLRLISESIEALIAAIYFHYGYQKTTDFVTNVVIKPYLAATTA